jgi:hypothetical protein
LWVARRVAAFGAHFELITQRLTCHFQPTFLKPLADYESTFSELLRSKPGRRPSQDKKGKQKDLDQYERDKGDFVDRVVVFTSQRTLMLGSPFRHLTAVFCKYIRDIGPTPDFVDCAQAIASPNNPFFSARRLSSRPSVRDDEDHKLEPPLVSAKVGDGEESAPNVSEVTQEMLFLSLPPALKTRPISELGGAPASPTDPASSSADWPAGPSRRGQEEASVAGGQQQSGPVGALDSMNLLSAGAIRAAEVGRAVWSRDVSEEQKGEPDNIIDRPPAQQPSVRIGDASRAAPDRLDVPAQLPIIWRQSSPPVIEPAVPLSGLNLPSPAPVFFLPTPLVLDPPSPTPIHNLSAPPLVLGSPCPTQVPNLSAPPLITGAPSPRPARELPGPPPLPEVSRPSDEEEEEEEEAGGDAIPPPPARSLSSPSPSSST